MLLNYVPISLEFRGVTGFHFKGFNKDCNSSDR